MKEKKVFLFLVASIILLLSILCTNIGYADENLTTYNPNYSYLSEDFNVEFNKNSHYIDNNIIIINSKKISLNNIVLTDIGEIKKFTIPVINNSMNLSAKLNPVISNSNSEYFKVTCQLSKSVLQAKSDEAIIEVQVQLIKMPLYSNETTQITIDIIAEPIY